MIEMAGVMCNYVADLGVSVTQDRTHLTGGEIQNCTDIGVVHEAALGTINDHRCEASPVPDQVLVRSVPELRICISRHVRKISDHGVQSTSRSPNRRKAAPAEKAEREVHWLARSNPRDCLIADCDGTRMAVRTR